jgi:hypothetical protein
MAEVAGLPAGTEAFPCARKGLEDCAKGSEDGIWQMNCYRDLIEAYLDEELAPGLKVTVEEHVSQCQICSRL